MPGRRQISVVEEEKRKKIDLRIEVEDFGPISGGEIKLKPLTVFIGPNNSGKSYAAMLVHSIFESYNVTSTIRQDPFSRAINLFAKEINELLHRFYELEEGDRLYIPIIAKRCGVSFSDVISELRE